MSQRRHYEGTAVSEGESLSEIEVLLRRHKVDATRWTNTMGVIRLEFSWPYQGSSLAFRVDLAIPRSLDGYTLTPKQREQERRRRLRVLLNHIKAKLVAVEDGLVDMEQEFLPYLLGPGDRTMGDLATEQIRAGLAAGAMPEVRLLQ